MDEEEGEGEAEQMGVSYARICLSPRSPRIRCANSDTKRSAYGEPICCGAVGLAPVQQMALGLLASLTEGQT